MNNKPHSIKITDLKFSYDKKKTVLDIKDLEIAEGEKVFLYGPSGFGKSTLLNLLAGVLKFDTGEIEVLGKKLSSLKETEKDKLRGSEIGYIFQIFNLIPYLNITDNITLPCRINKERSHGLNYHDQCSKLIETLGLHHHLDRNVTDLSIGQQQRVAQARALIGNPGLIIADEPTSSLDEKNTEDFMNLLMHEWENRKFTLLFVSHDERLKKYFERTISLPSINLAKIQSLQN
jgi:putative ABC transport system ATP-binding protein